MGNQEGIPSLDKRFDAPLNHGFGLGIDRCRGLIQDQKIRVQDHGPHQGHQLTLTGRKKQTPFTNRRIKPLG